MFEINYKIFKARQKALKILKNFRLYGTVYKSRTGTANGSSCSLPLLWLVSEICQASMSAYEVLKGFVLLHFMILHAWELLMKQ